MFEPWKHLIELTGILVACCLTSTCLHSQSMGVASSGEVLFGGPSVDVAREALMTAIAGQSSSNIVLQSFKSTTSKLVNPTNRPSIEFGFEAQIAFGKPCIWMFRPTNDTLGFKAFNLSQASALASNQVIHIPNAGESYVIVGSILFTPNTNGWTALGVTSALPPKPAPVFARERCIENLRFISTAFALYELQNDGHYPFAISTNAGGTLELCLRDSGGFDTNSFLHFKAMAEAFSSPAVLVCPSDSDRMPGQNFSNLAFTNVSYRLRTAWSGKLEANWFRVLCTCPFHGFDLYPGGNIEGKSDQ